MRNINIAIINDNASILQDILKNTLIFNIQIELNPIENILLVKKSHKATLIEYAAFYGAEKCFNLIFQLGKCSLNENIGKYAVCGGNLTIINQIIHANISLKNYIKYAIKFHHFEAFKRLFTLYFESDNNAYQDVHDKLCSQCIKFSSFKILRFLIEFGANINNCLIHEALTYNINSLFIFLMQFKIDLTKLNSKGQTALDCAKRSNNEYAAQIIQQKLKQ